MRQVLFLCHCVNRKTEGKGIKAFIQDHTGIRDMMELVGLKVSKGLWYKGVSVSVKAVAPVVSGAP